MIMGNQMRRGSESDDSVCRLRQTEHAISEKLRQNFVEGFHKRKVNHFHLVTMLSQLDIEPIHDEASAAVDKRNATRAEGNTHDLSRVLTDGKTERFDNTRDILTGDESMGRKIQAMGSQMIGHRVVPVKFAVGWKGV